MPPRPPAKAAASPAGHLVRRQAAVLPAVDEGGERAGRPALLVDVLGLDHLPHQADLVVGVEDGEIASAGRPVSAWRRRILVPMEWKVPSQGMPSATGPSKVRDALLHLARRLVGEGHGQDLRGEGAPGRDEMGDAGGQHARLAGAGAGQHEHGPVGRLDRAALLRVEAVEIGPGAQLPRGHAPPGRRGGGRYSSSRRKDRSRCFALVGCAGQAGRSGRTHRETRRAGR